MFNTVLVGVHCKVNETVPAQYSSLEHMAGFTEGGKLPQLNCFLFYFAVKTPNEGIYFQTFCNLLCVSINTKERSSNV